MRARSDRREGGGAAAVTGCRGGRDAARHGRHAERERRLVAALAEAQRAGVEASGRRRHGVARHAGHVAGAARCQSGVPRRRRRRVRHVHQLARRHDRVPARQLRPIRYPRRRTWHCLLQVKVNDVPRCPYEPCSAQTRDRHAGGGRIHDTLTARVNESATNKCKLLLVVGTFLENIKLETD